MVVLCTDQQHATGIRKSSSSLCGATVPARIRHRIEKGEFIDFHQFIDNKTDDNDNSSVIQLQYDNNEGKLVTKPRGNKKHMSFDMWYRCFRKFMAIFIKAHSTPDNAAQLSIEMLTYVDAVQDLRARGGDWEAFDIMFRRTMATDPFSWADKLTTVHLQLQCNGDAQIPSPRPSATATSDKGKEREKSSAKQSKEYVPYYYCFSYHTTGRCTNSNCGYNHKCHKCEGNHTALTCNVAERNYVNKNYKRFYRVPFTSSIEKPQKTTEVQKANANYLTENAERQRKSPSPIKPEKLKNLLQLTGYDKQETTFLIEGFRQGFNVGHNNKHLVNTKNIPDTKGKEADILEQKIKEEIKLGRMAGPFHKPPFDIYKLSPIFLREKSTAGQYRMILDLSFPKDETSINNNIKQSCKSVNYASVRDAIRIAANMKKGAFSAKLDISDAFRLIPIHPTDYNKFCFKNKNLYYFDRVLPQGCGSSCNLFEKFSTALQHIFEKITKTTATVHYLDDFIIFAEEETICKKLRDIFIQICEYIGVPLAPHKITEPATDTIFLGVKIDTINRQIQLPREKIIQYRHDIQMAAHKKSITLKNLQEIVGKLSFATAAVPGRAFLGRLFKLLQGAQTKKVIFWDKNTINDLNMWITFLQDYNGTTFFRSLQVMHSNTINLQADASKKGYGATFGRLWVQGEYPTDWQALNIAILEFYPIYLLMNMFGEKIKNSLVIFYTDNEAVSHIIKDTMTRDKIILYFLRNVTLKMVQYNIDLRAEHVPGVKNILCDKISRFQVSTELLEKYDMKLRPEPVPVHLQPNKLLLQQATT